MKLKRFPGIFATALALGLMSTAHARPLTLTDQLVFTTDHLYFDKSASTPKEDYTFENGVAYFYNGITGTHGWYDFHGNLTDEVSPSLVNGFALEKSGGEYYFTDSKGNHIGEFYQNAYDFYDDYALVQQNDTWFYIDQQGEVALQHLDYDYYGIFSDGVAMVGLLDDNGEMTYGYVDHRGDTILPFTQQIGGHMTPDDREHFRFSYNLAPYYDEETEKYGFQNMSGKVIIEPDYYYVFAFQEKLAYVKNSYFSGYINAFGIAMLTLDSYTGSSFQDGYAIVERTGTYSRIPYETRVVGVIENPYGVPDVAPQVTPDETTQPEVEDEIPQVEIPEVEPEPQVEVVQPVATSPSAAKVLVNGNEVDFGAYNVDGYTYFKLTDLAFALKGTASRFDVVWDNDLFAIIMDMGGTYAEKGTELSPAKSGLKGEKSNADIYWNKKKIEVSAYIIDGSSHFQLNGLQDYLGFTLGWDAANNTITIDTRVLG